MNSSKTQSVVYRPNGQAIVRESRQGDSVVYRETKEHEDTGIRLALGKKKTEKS